jgi:hypothetical protein
MKLHYHKGSGVIFFLEVASARSGILIPYPADPGLIPLPSRPILKQLPLIISRNAQINFCLSGGVSDGGILH